MAWTKLKWQVDKGIAKALGDELPYDYEYVRGYFATVKGYKFIIHSEGGGVALTVKQWTPPKGGVLEWYSFNIMNDTCLRLEYLNVDTAKRAAQFIAEGLDLRPGGNGGR